MSDRPGLPLPAVPLVMAAFVAGTTASFLFGGPWWASAGLAAIGALALLVAMGPGALRVGTLLVIGAAVAAAASGHARGIDADANPPPAIATLSGTHTIVGVAREDAQLRGTFATVDLRVESVDGEEQGGGLRLTLPAPDEPLLAGDRLRATVEIERPPVVADFDYPGYLRSRGIHAVGAFPSSSEVVGHDDGNVLTNRLRALRRWATGNIERSLPEPEASVAAGMLLGERRTIPAALSEELRVTGTTHLLVVSGQNVALLVGTIVAILGSVLPRRRAALFAILAIPLYVVFVGAEPPVVRAALMAVGIAVAAVSGRRTPGWLYLLYAVGIMLAIDPLLARDVAFQLSVAATAGILHIAPPLRDALTALAGRRAEGVFGGLVETFAVATAAALAVTPVQWAAFEQVSLVQIPANVAVAPLYESVLVVGMLAALFGWIPIVADVLHVAGAFAPAMFIAVVGVMADVPAATLALRAPLVAGVLWYVALLAAAFVIAPREGAALRFAGRGVAPVTVLLGVTAIGLWFAVLSTGEAVARIDVLDVGQGHAVLIRDGGSSILIDVGPPDGAATRALARVDAGRSLDAILLTHADRDHTGGLREIERRFDVGEVLTGAPAAGTATRQIDIGDRIWISPRTSVEVLSPPVVTLGAEHASENDRSLVLMVTIGDRRILLAADIEASAERWLIRSGISLAADVLLVPHHGSLTSSTPEFVQAVSPRVAVISVGDRNSYGHPRPEVLARYEDVLVIRTDLSGDITLRSDGERLWLASGP